MSLNEYIDPFMDEAVIENYRSKVKHLFYGLFLLFINKSVGLEVVSKIRRSELYGVTVIVFILRLAKNVIINKM